MHTAAQRRRSARAIAIAADDVRTLVAVGLVTLLGLVGLLITSPAAWLPAT